MTGALVPLERVAFRGGRSWREPSVLLAVPPLPRNTCDHRYPFCIDHHLACDCREAEQAEMLGEYRYELNAVRRAAVDVLAGHRLFDYGDDRDAPPSSDRDERMRLIRGDGPLACQCSGCRLMRAADISGLWRHTRDEGVLRGAR